MRTFRYVLIIFLILSVSISCGPDDKKERFSVLSMAPAKDSTGIPITSQVSATFNTEIDPATVNSSSFKLRAGTVNVSGTISFDSTMRTIFFTPNTIFSHETSYIAEISTELKDVHGRSLPSSFSWSFTTSPPLAITGKIEIPADIDPTSITVVSMNQTSAVRADGTFDSVAKEIGVTTIGAMLSGKPFGLMGVVIRDVGSGAHSNMQRRQKGEDSEFIINSITTAESMVFVSPYLYTNNPSDSEIIMNVIKTDPKVRDLASVLDLILKEADPLDDPRFANLYTEAINSVLSTLFTIPGRVPTQSVQSQKSLHSIFLPTLEKESSHLTNCPPLCSIDAEFMKLEVSQSGNQYIIRPEVVSGLFLKGGVDWHVDFAELDPAKFPISLDSLRNHNVTNEMIFERLPNGFSDFSHVESWIYFTIVDLLQQTIDTIANLIFPDKSVDIHVSTSKPAIYVSRMYSGGWQDPDEKNSVIPRLPNGVSFHRSALTTNIVVGAVDSISIFLDLKGIPCFQAEVVPVMVAEAVATITRHEAPGLDLSHEAVTAMIVDVISTGITETPKCVLTEARRNALITIAKLGKVALKTAINVPGKIASGGQLAARIYGLCCQVTPLETILVVVGDPFAPIPTPNPSDQSSPSIAITTPTTASTYNTTSSTITLSGTASDNVGVTQVSWVNSRGGSGTASGTTNWSVSNITLQTGDNVITITARDAAGNTESDTLTATLSVPTPTPTPLPAAPTGLSLTVLSSDRISLIWRDNSSNETGFKIERKTGSGGTFSTLPAVVGPSNDTGVSFEDTGLSASTTYCYRVKASNAAGDSSPSNEPCDTTQSAPIIVPTVFTDPATGITSVSAILNGRVNPNGVTTGVVFEWGTNSAPPYGNTTSNVSIGSETRETNIISNLSNLTPNTTYKFRIIAKNDLQGLAFGAEQSFTTSTPSGPTEKILNGSFSSGLSNWTRSGDFWAGTNLSNYRTSPGYAAGGVTIDGTPKDRASGYIYQTVNIPSNATSATLRFWYYITSNENPGASQEFDFLDVMYYDVHGNALETLAHLSNRDQVQQSGDYQEKVVTRSVERYRGQTLHFRIASQTDGRSTTVFRIDDVSLMIDGN